MTTHTDDELNETPCECGADDQCAMARRAEAAERERDELKAALENACRGEDHQFSRANNEQRLREAAEARARTAETDRDEWKSQFDTSDRVIAELTNDLAVANITIAMERERVRIAEEGLKAPDGRALYWRNAYETLVAQTGRDLNDGYGIDPRKAVPSPLSAKKEANRG